MAIEIPPDCELIINRLIASGQFSTLEDVLRAALRQLEDVGITSLQDSLADEAAGRVVSLESAAASIQARLGIEEQISANQRTTLEYGIAEAEADLAIEEAMSVIRKRV